MKPFLLPALLLGVGLVAGFGLGRMTSPAGSQDLKTDNIGDGQGTREGRALSERGPEAGFVGKPEPDGALRPAEAAHEFRRAIDIPDPVASTERFAAALQQLGPDEFPAAAKALWAQPGNPRELNEQKRLLAWRWGQAAGAEAVEFAQSQTGQGKITAISGALAGWASADPAAAKSWIDTRAEPAVRQLYDLALVDGWARHDIGAAADHVLERPADRISEQMIRVVAGEHTRQDPAAAGAWAVSLPKSELRDAALTEVGAKWAWADGPAAIDWISGLSAAAGEIQAVMRTAMGTWTRRDPEAASQYLNEMPVGTARDHAISALSRAIAFENPDASAKWAEAIRDAALRDETLKSIGGEE